MAPTAAVTGGTGFLGRYLALALARKGYRIRMLARRDPVHPQLRALNFDIVPGGLGNRAALDRLVEGADVVIHAAGLVKAANPAAFWVANRDGAAEIGAAMRRCDSAARLVVVSSLAARAPGLSAYAASKRGGEEAAIAALGSRNWLILRPAAIYGPWDRELLTFFRAASRGWLPIIGPLGARVTLIHAEDAAAGIVDLAEAAPSGQTYVLADATREGYSWPELGAQLASAVGVKGRSVRIPSLLLWAAGVAAGCQARVTGRATIISPGKIREILHTDWGVSEREMPPSAIWQPRWPLDKGWAATADWYRRAGLLGGSGQPY